MDIAINVLISLISFIAVLGLVVFVHEMGHFQAAKWCKVAIERFSIGFGNPLLSWKDKHGVDWWIASIPLGGYVKFVGDANGASGPAADIPEDAAEREAQRKQGLFHAQPVAARAFIVAAGPLANFIFAIIAFALLSMVTGVDRTPAVITRVAADSPAAAAGLQPGDVIRSANDQRVDTLADLQVNLMLAREGRSLELGFDRNGARQQVIVTPVMRELTDPVSGEVQRRRIIGIESNPPQRDIFRPNIFQSLGVGMERTWDFIALQGVYVYNIFTGNASGEHISGPLGIAQFSGKAATQSFQGGGEQAPFLQRIVHLVIGLGLLAAAISVAVGVANLLPVPVLDGGHLVFYAIEAARNGRPLAAKTQELAFKAGLAVLLALFLFATWNDINRLIG